MYITKTIILLCLMNIQTIFTIQENLMTKKEFVAELYKIGAIQFGEFTYVSGLKAPNYIDLRRLMSFPYMLKAATDLLWQDIKHCRFDYITGVPYAALPLASSLAVTHDIPMIMPRKERKSHGTKQLIEGVFDAGKTCLLIEDLFTSGGSTLDTIAVLQENGLAVTDIAIILDREQGGKENIEKRGYHVHALFTMSELADILTDLNLINSELAHATKCFSQQNRIVL